MTKLHVIKCDTCGKEVPTSQAQQWLEVSKFNKMILDFCSVYCLKLYAATTLEKYFSEN
jgi:ribosomal protein S26